MSEDEKPHFYSYMRVQVFASWATRMRHSNHGNLGLWSLGGRSPQWYSSSHSDSSQRVYNPSSVPAMQLLYLTQSPLATKKFLKGVSWVETKNGTFRQHELVGLAWEIGRSPCPFTAAVWSSTLSLLVIMILCSGLLFEHIEVYSAYAMCGKQSFPANLEHI